MSLVMYVKNPAIRKWNQRLKLRPVPDTWPRLRTAVRATPPWALTALFIGAAAYLSYRILLVSYDIHRSLMLPDVVRMCTRANQSPAGCSDYADPAAAVIVGFATFGIWILLLAIVIRLNYAHKALSGRFADDASEMSQVATAYGLFCLAVAIAALIGVFEFHLFMPEVPEIVPQPRDWLPPDRRA